MRNNPFSDSTLARVGADARAAASARRSRRAAGPFRRIAATVALLAWVAPMAALTLDSPSLEAAREQNPVPLTGQADPGVAVVVEARDPAGARVAHWAAKADAAGRFALAVDRAALPDGRWLALRARTEAGGDLSEEARLFIHPLVDRARSLPAVKADGRQLLLDGRPWGFAGLNYTRFLIEFSIRGSFERMVEDVRRQAEWGVKVLRVPLHLGMFQPTPGVFPDHPDYLPTLQAHGLNLEFHALFEHFIAVCGHYGIRVVLDWHELPTDPYRYFVGGNHHDKGTGRPGRGIAWLVDPVTGRAAEPGEPRFTEALVTTNRWLARHWRGNGTILGFEAPYNEPHSVTDSSDAAWRQLTFAAAWAIAQEDPDRLIFGMAPAWGHNNVLPSVTWQLPGHLTGMAPHYYLGNGPIAVRADAAQRKEPWLARDVAATFDHGFAAVALPHSAAPYPVWNGESGEHGYESFLPELDRHEAASYMIEAQLVQAYAAGMAGSLGWTLTGHERVYEPMAELYRAAYQRFSPVFAAGPVDYRQAQVLLVQNPGAVPVHNGLNYAGVPFVRLALDLHLAPVHYMTDDQLLSQGLIQISVGLEQVEEVAAGLSYRAAVVDTRNVDTRALALLERSGIPLLRVDDAADLAPEQLAEFLAAAGVTVDRRTPPEWQVIKGPAHLLVYRRAGEGAGRVYPHWPLEGEFELRDEQGRVAFRGTAEALARDGLAVDLPKWRTAIFALRPSR